MTPGLNLSNFSGTFFLQNLSENRSDNVSLLNFRLDKSFKVGLPTPRACWTSTTCSTTP
ncbi:MAG: hypothetical protein U0Q12_02875 [Vicinamibacterales bacterium]